MKTDYEKCQGSYGRSYAEGVELLKMTVKSAVNAADFITPLGGVKVFDNTDDIVVKVTQSFTCEAEVTFSWNVFGGDIAGAPDDVDARWVPLDVKVNAPATSRTVEDALAFSQLFDKVTRLALSVKTVMGTYGPFYRIRNRHNV